VSLREGKLAILACKEGRLVLALVHVRMWFVVMVLCPHHGMGWRSALEPVVMALLARWWFTDRPVRCGLAMVFIIISCSPGGIVHELAAVPGSSVVLLVVEPLTMILSFGVVTFIGLASLGSQDRSREPHPMVGGAVRSSHRAVFGRWFTVPVVTARWCCLVYGVLQGRRLFRDGCPLGPSGLSKCACPYQDSRTWWSSTPLHPSQGSGRRRGRAELGSVW
jgi:hypothetical protein